MDEKKLKLRPSLMPLEWRVALTTLLCRGALKYAPRDWEENPQPYMNRIDSLERHLISWLSGAEYDDETGIQNLVAVAFNALMIYTWQARGLGVDDRPPMSQTEIASLKKLYADAARKHFKEDNEV